MSNNSEIITLSTIATLYEKNSMDRYDLLIPFIKWCINNCYLVNEKINYKIYKNTDDDVVIRIKDSYKITNSSIKRKILTEIINSEQGRLNNLSEEDLNYYMNEWACHNMGYRYPSIASLLNSDMTRNSALDSCRHVDLNKGDNKSKYYRLLGGLCEFFY